MSSHEHSRGVLSYRRPGLAVTTSPWRTSFGNEAAYTRLRFQPSATAVATPARSRAHLRMARSARPISLLNDRLRLRFDSRAVEAARCPVATHTTSYGKAQWCFFRQYGHVQACRPLGGLITPGAICSVTAAWQTTQWMGKVNGAWISIAADGNGAQRYYAGVCGDVQLAREFRPKFGVPSLQFEVPPRIRCLFMAAGMRPRFALQLCRETWMINLRILLTDCGKRVRAIGIVVGLSFVLLGCSTSGESTTLICQNMSGSGTDPSWVLTLSTSTQTGEMAVHVPAESTARGVPTRHRRGSLLVGERAYEVTIPGDAAGKGDQPWDRLRFQFEIDRHTGVGTLSTGNDQYANIASFPIRCEQASK